MAIQIYVESGKPIHIGRMGENLAVTINFDIKYFLDNFGNTGNFKILLLQDELIEIEEDLEVNNNLLKWTIISDYTLKKGEGKCQVVYQVDSLISKSEIFEIFVSEGFDGGNI